MIDRITKNEERLNSILLSIENLEEALSNFKSNNNNIRLLNKYYGSINWFKDKDNYERGYIKKIKAGVLSEDAVWNMNEDIMNLISEMKEIIKNLNKK